MSVSFQTSGIRVSALIATLHGTVCQTRLQIDNDSVEGDSEGCQQSICLQVIFLMYNSLSSSTLRKVLESFGMPIVGQRRHTCTHSFPSEYTYIDLLPEIEVLRGNQLKSLSSLLGLAPNNSGLV
eukprot:4605679-Amphidinium_carterae.2